METSLVVNNNISYLMTNEHLRILAQMLNALEKLWILMQLFQPQQEISPNA